MFAAESSGLDESTDMIQIGDGLIVWKTGECWIRGGSGDSFCYGVDFFDGVE